MRCKTGKPHPFRELGSFFSFSFENWAINHKGSMNPRFQFASNKLVSFITRTIKKKDYPVVDIY